MCNGLGYIVPIVLFSVLYNLVKFFEIETVYIEAEARWRRPQVWEWKVTPPPIATLCSLQGA